VSQDGTAEEATALTACYAAAAAGTDLFGERAGSPALRLVDPSQARPDEPVAIAYGVNVHAKVRVHGNDVAQNERLCRYLCRPPLAEERLSWTTDGRLRDALKRAWKDGTRAVRTRLPVQLAAGAAPRRQSVHHRPLGGRGERGFARFSRARRGRGQPGLARRVPRRTSIDVERRRPGVPAAARRAERGRTPRDHGAGVPGRATAR